jgi:para-nitrobenzyl esterase
MRPIILAALLVFSAAPALAQEAQPMQKIALQEFPPKNGAHLTITTPSWPDGGDIPFANTQYRTNTFPGLSWTAGPAGTKSYAIIMQDPDASRNGQPILHWTMYNLPASVTKLDPGMMPDAKPAGSSYGPNVRGDAQPYMGPHTPPGPKHHYHLQVFALDAALTADPAMSYDGLTGQMKGHVLASGELVGLAQADPDATPPPALTPVSPRPRVKRG